MKIGDLVKTNGGYIALVIDMETYYPHHPKSPPRNCEVQFLGKEPSWVKSVTGNDGTYHISAHTIRKIVNEAR